MTALTRLLIELRKRLRPGVGSDNFESSLSSSLSIISRIKNSSSTSKRVFGSIVFSRLARTARLATMAYAIAKARFDAFLSRPAMAVRENLAGRNRTK
jgi:hypothetical protein